MNRPRLIRWLRVAVSAVCVMMVVGLSWLWIRSYREVEFFCFSSSNTRRLEVCSTAGTTYLTYGPSMLGEFPRILVVGQGRHHYWPIVPGHDYWASIERKKNDWDVWLGPRAKWHGRSGFGFAHIPRGWIISIPHWFIVALSAALAFVLWLPWYKVKLHWRFNFSLRTLLIVTTLVAVVLGLLVWAIR